MRSAGAKPPQAVGMEPEAAQARVRAMAEEEIETILRSRRPQLVSETRLTPSAVVILLLKRDEGWYALFTKRSAHVNSHKGEISFPGGVIEEGESPLGAALRELEEEVGIKKESLRLLGELDEILTISGYRIRPFVAALAWPVKLAPSKDEVDEVYILPLDRFLDPAVFKVKHWDRNGQDYPVYYYEFPECTVWGATAKILRNFLERILAPPLS